jgi:putative protease
MYDDDLAAMRASIAAARAAGVDALIVSDMAAVLAAADAGMELHASTQLNIANREAVRFFARWCDVMVLARELNLQQVAALHRFITEEAICGPKGKPVAIEMFCHGALCMAVSGKCYLSLHEYNRSANRGQCVQVCRRAYTATDAETGRQLGVAAPNIFSPKDLCTLGFLDKMAAAGVRVFKVEGRARGPEYVKAVGDCYGEALQALCTGAYNADAVAGWMERLQRVFNRGFWDGYYLGATIGELTDAQGSKATRTKEYVALCTNYFSKINVAEFRMQSGALAVGDTALIIGHTTGAVEMNISELRIDASGTVGQVSKGDIFSMPVKQTIRRGDKLYLWK